MGTSLLSVLVSHHSDQQKMSKIKLTHYNARGRAETIRLVLAYAGKEFEDKRIAPEDMPSLKPSLPFGQLPVLEVDGDMIGQSMAIARYLASECGIAGSSGLVKAQVDEVVDVINDVQNAMYGASFEKDEKVKAEKMKKVGEETIPNNLANLEKVLERRAVLCWELSHLGGTPLPPAGRLDFHPEPQVSGRHSQACEPRRENQEGSKHQEVAGGQTVHRVLERKIFGISFLFF